ncbi:MAG: GNAT family N-acetyltransferase, partial [Candidatus Heimdallarchaeota archaeon]
DMIREDPSHSVAGTYSIENITNRPDNIYILICKSDKIEFILNIKENEEVLIQSYLFSNFNDPIEAKIVLHYIISFLSIFDKLFTFGSGLDLVDFLRENLEYENTSEQLVFGLDSLKPNEIPKEVGDEMLLFDGMNNNERLDVVREAYGYQDRAEDLVRYLDINPHVVIKAVDSSEIIAKARINAYTKKYAVIGGVQTIKKFRQQGYGFRVSYKITNYILQKSDKVVLDTDTGNFPAIKIYEKIGFERIGKSIFIEKGKKVIAAIYGDRDY